MHSQQKWIQKGVCVCVHKQVCVYNKRVYQLGGEDLWRGLREGIWEGGNVILEHFKKEN